MPKREGCSSKNVFILFYASEIEFRTLMTVIQSLQDADLPFTEILHSGVIPMQ